MSSTADPSPAAPDNQELADELTATTAAEPEALTGQDYEGREASGRSGSSPAGSDGVGTGHGERALRQLRDDGVI